MNNPLPTNYYEHYSEWQSSHGQPGYAQPSYVPQPAYPPVSPYPVYSIAATLPERGRGFALAGLVLGITSLTACVTFFLGSPVLILLGWLIGIPLSIVGSVLSAIGCRSTSRRAMAIIGLILSIIALVLLLLTLVIGIAYASTHPA
jgi:hypothetical protein